MIAKFELDDDAALRIVRFPHTFSSETLILLCSFLHRKLDEKPEYLAHIAKVEGILAERNRRALAVLAQRDQRLS